MTSVRNSRKHGVALPCLLTVALLLPSCLSDAPPPPQPTQLEMRNFQTREYDTYDAKMVMKAVLNVLQDMGFIVGSADTEIGLLTANRWTDVQHSKKEVKKATKNEVTLSKSIVLDCTANISAFGKTQTRVRVNFQQRILDANGNAMQAFPIQDADFYQTFFAQVDKGIFLQQEGV